MSETTATDGASHEPKRRRTQMNEPERTPHAPAETGGLIRNEATYWRERCQKAETERSRAIGRTRRYKTIARKMERRARHDTRLAADMILLSIDLRKALNELHSR